MEYQKVINVSDNTSNQPSKVGTKNCVKKKYDASGTYNKKVDAEFSMLNQVYVIIVIHIYL